MYGKACTLSKASLAVSYLITACLLALLSGCGGMQKVMPGAAADEEPPPFAVHLPESVLMQSSDVPQDIKMVVAASLYTIRHEKTSVPKVRFDPQGRHVLAEPDFAYSGFGLAAMTVDKYETRETESGSVEVDLSVQLLFLDGLGRTSSVLLDAVYEVDAKGIVVQDSRAAAIPPIFPSVECYYVAAADFREHFSDAQTFQRWYTLTREWAEVMVMTPQEAEKRAALEQRTTFEKLKGLGSIDKQEYYVLVFCLDRMPQGAELEVIPTKQPRAAKKPMAEVAQLNFDGWRVAVYGAMMHLNHPDAEVTTLVYYTPDPDVLVQVPGRHLVGRFSSLKRKAESASSARPATAPVQTRLLDPADREDARVIQSRLSELGYYTMKVDGLWGKGSMGALQAFQKDNGLPANGNWNRSTQDLLMR